MIDRLFKVRSALKDVLEEMTMDSPLLNSDWGRLEQLMKILKPFKVHTDLLQTDSMPLSHVLPSLFELILHLRDPSLHKTLAQSLLQNLRKRF